ncbi:MAG: GTPase Era [Candidatus Cloacimonetes bacterium]|jgi:GTP-binding protein Era|nr:GTPase Era [Candidatus Cloacimonadota bacterium]MBT4576558.1 GTPase Era [Candidatus Cloacimonadota bacterium]MBT5419368.1 GTPase Era [Candidatus Cloacimonadota bacterium]
MNINYRAGFVSIVGKPNVGKSTLMNKLLGEKLSITSPKPQTTRQQIKGIISDDDRQIILMDTPGFVEARYELHNKMLEYINNSLKDSDIIIFMTDAKKFPTDYDKQICENLKRLNVPKIAMLNKIDLTDQATTEKKLKLLEEYDFERIIPISVLKTSNLNLFLEELTSLLPINPPFYSTDEISDLPMRFFAQETIREQIFLNFDDEIPYASTVVVEQYHDFPNKVVIAANIWLEKKSQKPIVIGKDGRKIKLLRIAAEKEIHKIVEKRVKLDLWIKIKPNWRKKQNALKEFGYR